MLIQQIKHIAKIKNKRKKTTQEHTQQFIVFMSCNKCHTISRVCYSEKRAELSSLCFREALK